MLHNKYILLFFLINVKYIFADIDDIDDIDDTDDTIVVEGKFKILSISLSINK